MFSKIAGDVLIGKINLIRNPLCMEISFIIGKINFRVSNLIIWDTVLVSFLFAKLLRSNCL